MTINASRFKVLDREFNAPIEKFTSALDSQILNNLANAGIEIPAPLSNLINTATQAATKLSGLSKIGGMSDLKQMLNSVSREAKGIAGSVKDLQKLGDVGIDSVVKNIVSNTGVTKALRDSVKDIKAPGLNLGSGSKLYSLTGNLDGQKYPIGKLGSLSDHASGLSDTISKIAPSFKHAVENPNAELSKVVGLSSAGYSTGLKGVFKALTDGSSKDLINRATAVLTSNLSKSGKTDAIVDILKDQTHANPTTYLPNAVSSTMSNYKPVQGMKPRHSSGLFKDVLDVVKKIDRTWNKSKLSRHPSLAKIEKYSSSLDKAWAKSRTTGSIKQDSLEKVQATDDTFLSAAYSILGNISQASDGLADLNRRVRKFA